MKTRFLLAALLASAGPAIAQTPPAYGCDTPESKQLDFWVGEWELAFAGADGKPVKSRNRVSKILDGCVVLEEFDGTPGTPLKGHSVSTFDRAAKRWKQTWVDNTGAYLDLVGDHDAGDMVFARQVERQGKKIRMRMVFRDVRADSLTWLWQRSDDDGKSWSNQWEIAYRRLR
jgi:hypothetical protein